MAIRKENGYQRKERGNSKRKQKRIILIAAEGRNKTETNYFKKWNNSEYRIAFVKNEYTDPVNMVNALDKDFKAKRLSHKNGDMGFCLVDHDCQSSKDELIMKADKIANKKNLKLLVSNPCFELWYLCHFIRSTRQYSSSSAVVEELKRYYPQYKKEDDSIVEAVREKTGVAIENAKFIEKHCLENGYENRTATFQPSTDIYKLIEILKES